MANLKFNMSYGRSKTQHVIWPVKNPPCHMLLLGAGYVAIPIMYSQRLSGFLEFLSAVLEFQIIVVVALK